MKRLLLFSLLSTALFAISCSNDFEVNAKWKDIPVVYGLLDVSDTANYIRVERAFLTNDENALDIAKIADSIFYENASVQLERLSNGQLFNLQKVDGNDWGYPRDSGVFATEPNWLFRIDSSELLLKPGEKIKLRLDRGNGLPEVTSTTYILKPIKLENPQGSQGFNFTNFGMTNIAWTAEDSALIFDLTLYVQYAEYLKTDPGTLYYKTIKWPWKRGLRRDGGNNTFQVEKLGIEFYQLLKNNIEENQDFKRIFLGIDIEIIAGGQTLQNYVDVSLANTGITASQDVPTFSNLSEGKGIFGSVYKLRKLNLGLKESTRDSLKNGYLTKALNF